MTDSLFANFAFAPTGAPSAYAKNLPDRLSYTSVSVKDFGATGNGTTDDTDFIQAAFDFAFGSYMNPHANMIKNKAVYFPPGQYITTKMLTLRSIADGYIHGAGVGSTRITYKGPIAASDGGQNSPKTILLRTNGFARVFVEDIWFEMTGAGKASPTPFAYLRGDSTVCFDWNWDNSGINTTGCIWQNCKFTGATYGFTCGAEYYDPPLGTSTTTNTLGPVASFNGQLTTLQSTTKGFTTQTGKSAFFPVGAIIEVGLHDPDDYYSDPLMRGTVVSYNNSTGALVFDTLTAPIGQQNQGAANTVLHPITPGSALWYIFESRKTFITQPGLEANFLVSSQSSPALSPPNDYKISSYDRPHVVSYNNTTGQLVLDTSAWGGGASYYGASGGDPARGNGGWSWQSIAPPTVTGSNWTFRHWWGFECDASNWFNCVIEDCYIGIMHSNFNVINSQYLAGAFRRCLSNGWMGVGGICQCLIGVTFEHNGELISVIGGAPGDDGGNPYWQNFTDVLLNQNAPTIFLGCHSTSEFFVGASAGGVVLMGCQHYGVAGDVSHPAYFYRVGGGYGPTQIESCVSANGALAGFSSPAVNVCDSSFVYNWDASTAVLHEFITASPFKFAQLPPSGSMEQGLVVTINDATVNTWSTPVTSGTGGSGFSISMQWNGTAWTVIGK